MPHDVELTTKPRGIPARYLRRGDQVAFDNDRPLNDRDQVHEFFTTWATIARIRAGGVDLPMAVEFDSGLEEELLWDDHVVVREVCTQEVV